MNLTYLHSFHILQILFIGVAIVLQNMIGGIKGFSIALGMALIMGLASYKYSFEIKNGN